MSFYLTNLTNLTSEGNMNRKFVNYTTPHIVRDDEHGIALIQMNNNHKLYAVIDIKHIPLVENFKWYVSFDRYGKAIVRSFPKKIPGTMASTAAQYLSRLLKGVNETDTGIEIDHKNGDGLDNR